MEKTKAGKKTAAATPVPACAAAPAGGTVPATGADTAAAAGRTTIDMSSSAPAGAATSSAGPESPEQRRKRLKALVHQAPTEAGVYLMHDKSGEIIYVGKAKVLRNRLSSYFSGRKEVKTRHLVSRIENIEWILAGSEYEALLLENNLIKEHRPKYNIDLKDGKTYPSIRVTNEPFPRVFRTRRIINDGSTYFGPFPSAETIDIYLGLIKRLFPLRRCSSMKGRKDPCMYYHIGRCSAPCVGKIDEADYAIHVEEVKRLLSGDTAGLLASLQKRMEAASAALHFEEAAQLRDAAEAIRLFAGKANAVDFADPEARDYIAWEADGDLIVFVVLQMRGGKLSGRDLYRSRVYGTESEALSNFLMEYYSTERLPPAKIFIASQVRSPAAATGSAASAAPARTDSGTPDQTPAEAPAVSMASAGLQAAESTPPFGAGAAEAPAATRGTAAAPAEPPRPEAAAGPAAPSLLPEGLDLLSSYVARELKADTDFRLPDERRHEVAAALARQNAHEELVKRRRELGDRPALEDLKRILNLSRIPERIEGFDIAQLAGKYTVASLVSFKNGVPDKKNYRYFKIKSLEGAIDDFGSIREAVARRYTRLVNEEAELPDLILVDGGAGQVSSAKEILDALGVDSDLAGLAKQNEEIYLPDQSGPVVLPKDSPALRVLVAVRDETHRFATGLNQRLRSGELKFGTLEAIKGVGRERSRRLMRVFGSLDLIASAEPATIAQAAGISEELAHEVKTAAQAAVCAQDSS